MFTYNKPNSKRHFTFPNFHLFLGMVKIFELHVESHSVLLRMVHSAVKRQSYLLQSETVVPLDEVVEQDHPPSYETPCLQTVTCTPKDPKENLQATLKYLSDMELFHLIITRLSKATPWKAPLYLTTKCIEGVHDFFRPNSPVTDSVHLPGLESPHAAVSNPFGRISITCHDSERLRGKFNIPGARKISPELLTSLATFFAFLEPAELRTVIQKRIADSVSPHRPIECFLEFLKSGGDDIPCGKVKLMNKRSKLRENSKDKKKQKRVDAAQQQGESSSMPPAAKTNSRFHGLSTHDDSAVVVDRAHDFSETELEDGEIFPHKESTPSDPPRFVIQSSAPFSLRLGAAMPQAGEISGSGTAPPPKKKKRRTGKAARRAQREVSSCTSIAHGTRTSVNWVR